MTRSQSGKIGFATRVRYQPRYTTTTRASEYTARPGAMARPMDWLQLDEYTLLDSAGRPRRRRKTVRACVRAYGASSSLSFLTWKLPSVCELDALGSGGWQPKEIDKRCLHSQHV
jgi:hypothetical protein